MKQDLKSTVDRYIDTIDVTKLRNNGVQIPICLLLYLYSIWFWFLNTQGGKDKKNRPKTSTIG